jgi:hypothetical protein
MASFSGAMKSKEFCHDVSKCPERSPDVLATLGFQLDFLQVTSKIRRMRNG